MANNKIIAVDVGNGFGKAAICVSEKADPNNLLSKWPVGIPTVAYIADDGSVEVAHKARSKKTGRAVRAVKSFIGRENFVTDDGTVYSPAKVYGLLAAELVKQANEGLKLAGEQPIYDIVLTYPSCFINDKNGMDKLEIMRKAVEEQKIDGKNIHVVQTISEAAAAALDALYYERHLNKGGKYAQKEKYAVMIGDIGHGTYDLSVVTSSDNKDVPYDIIDQSGDDSIGGKAFNQMLLGVVLQQLRDKYSLTELSPRDREQLETQIVPEIKHGLGDNNNTWTNNDLYVDGIGNVEITVERSEFERIITHSVNTIIQLMAEALENAKNTGIEIDEIILTGGSSNIPMIEREVKSRICAVYPNINVRKFRPEHGVVFGAARYAAGLAAVQHPEYAYGIRYSEDLLNKVNICLPSNATLAATGGSLVQRAEGVVIHVDVFRSNKKGVTQGTLSEKDCKSVQFFTFDVKEENKNKECVLSISMDTERRITAHCKLPDGRVLSKNWYSENLIDRNMTDELKEKFI